MTPKEIVAKSAHSLDNFEPIDRKPSKSNPTRIREAVAPLLLHILYEKTGAIHNLIGLIRPEAAYVARYGAAFPEPTRFGAYDPSIDDDATAVVRGRTEVAHKAKRTNRMTYETARRETTQSVLAVVADTWVRELRDTEIIYTYVASKDLLAHLQAGCTGQHALELLALHNKMQRYHLKVEGIPEYINMLEDAQKQASRAGQTIADETLLLFAKTVMLTTERFPRANKDWEDRAKSDKTWTLWKQVYKKAHTKACIKAQANKVTVKFGAESSAVHQETTQNVENKRAVNDVGMKALEGYFDNLAAAAVNEKLVLEQLVANNTKLAANNESLVVMVKN